MNQSPIACDMSAIPADQREAHETLARRLFIEEVLDQKELPYGYAFRFAAERYHDLVAYVANERLCCPFFNFGLETTPDQGPIWLRLTGREGAKELLESELLAVQG